MSNKNNKKITIFNNNKLESIIYKDESLEMEDEFFANFVGIFSLYIYYIKLFPSNNKLH